MRKNSNLIAGFVAFLLLAGTLVFLNNSSDEFDPATLNSGTFNGSGAGGVKAKPKVASLEEFLSSLASNKLPADGEFSISPYKEPLLLAVKDLTTFSTKVDQICQTLPSAQSQLCFTQAGVALFRAYPKDLVLIATACSKLTSPNTVGLNRTPNKFCGSGVFYSFFDVLSGAVLTNSIDTNGFDLLHFCANLGNSSSFPCSQESGKFVAINHLIPTVSALYHYCDPLQDPLLRDQCATGIGRGLAINGTGPIKASFQKCLSVDFIDYSTKCFSSFGMVNESTQLSDADFKLCTTQDFTSKIECQISLGVYAFGQIHGDMHNLITYCATLSEQENYAYCMLGAYRTFIYNLKLIRNYQTKNGFTELCHLDREYQDVAFTQLCQAALISSLSAEDSKILDNDFLVKFCTTKGSDPCFQAIGYLAKRLGISELALVKYCISASCKDGYRGNLAIQQKKLKIN